MNLHFVAVKTVGGEAFYLNPQYVVSFGPLPSETGEAASQIVMTDGSIYHCAIDVVELGNALCFDPSRPEAWVSWR